MENQNVEHNMNFPFPTPFPQCCKLQNEYAFKKYCDGDSPPDAKYFDHAVALRDYLRGKLEGTSREPGQLCTSDAGTYALLLNYATKGTTVGNLLLIPHIGDSLLADGVDEKTIYELSAGYGLNNTLAIMIPTGLLHGYWQALLGLPPVLGSSEPFLPPLRLYG